MNGSSLPPVRPETEHVPTPSPPAESAPPERSGWEELLLATGGLITFLAALGGALACLWALGMTDERSDAETWGTLYGGFRAIGFAVHMALLLAIFARLTRRG